MDFNNIVHRNLPPTGSTITYGDLRRATRIRRGLSGILEEMARDGKVAYTLKDGQATDTMPIRVLR